MKEKGIVVANLIITLTHRCNMNCDHCLRGPSENVDIPYHVIDKILTQIDNIYDIVFTGGEPMLNTEAMRYIFNRLIELKKEPSRIWFATNGKIFDIDFIFDFVDFVLNHTIDAFDDLENGIGSTIAVSQDPYHDNIKYLDKWKLFRFVTDDKNWSVNHMNEDGVIRKGNAEINGIGKPRKMRRDLYIDEYDDYYDIETLVIDVNGDILADCDFAYDEVEEYSLGNIKEAPLIKIIENNLREQEEQNEA